MNRIKSLCLSSPKVNWQHVWTREDIISDLVKNNIVLVVASGKINDEVLHTVCVFNDKYVQTCRQRKEGGPEERYLLPYNPYFSKGNGHQAIKNFQHLNGVLKKHSMNVLIPFSDAQLTDFLGLELKNGQVKVKFSWD
jgi:hypothetical protein